MIKTRIKLESPANQKNLIKEADISFSIWNNHIDLIQNSWSNCWFSFLISEGCVAVNILTNTYNYYKWLKNFEISPQNVKILSSLLSFQYFWIKLSLWDWRSFLMHRRFFAVCFMSRCPLLSSDSMNCFLLFFTIWMYFSRMGRYYLSILSSVNSM